jgi:hypothetical protein
VREERLRGATRVGKALLSGMVRKNWIAREDVSAARDAARVVKVAVLRSVETPVPLAAEGGEGARPPHWTGRARPSTAKKLNENQRTLIETLAASGGRLPVEALARVGCAAHHAGHAGAARVD